MTTLRKHALQQMECTILQVSIAFTDVQQMQHFLSVRPSSRPFERCTSKIRMMILRNISRDRCCRAAEESNGRKKEQQEVNDCLNYDARQCASQTKQSSKVLEINKRRLSTFVAFHLKASSAASRSRLFPRFLAFSTIRADFIHICR